jgi:hypothetical protein
MIGFPELEEGQKEYHLMLHTQIRLPDFEPRARLPACLHARPSS